MRQILSLFVLVFFLGSLNSAQAAYAAYYDHDRKVPIVAVYPEVVEVKRTSPHTYLDSLPRPPYPAYVVEPQGVGYMTISGYSVYGLYGQDEPQVWGYFLGSDWINYRQRGQRIYGRSQPVAYVPMNADGYHEPDQAILGYDAAGRTVYVGR